jgi:hypothetical protein
LLQATISPVASVLSRTLIALRTWLSLAAAAQLNVDAL